MNSKIAEHIKLTSQPVAVMRSDSCPQGAVMLPEGKWACVISMLNAAANGKTAALSDKTTVCKGGRAGTGFQPYELGTIEYFLSVGGRGPKAGEFYKKNPELAKDYLTNIPAVEPKNYLVFEPLSLVEDKDNIESVIFMVNADQLSALVTLANYDRQTQDNVSIKFGSGCAQSILYSIDDSINERDTCTIGLTDPSARKCIDKDILSFSIPYKRFLEMESNADESFLTKETWEIIKKRI